MPWPGTEEHLNASPSRRQSNQLLASPSLHASFRYYFKLLQVGGILDPNARLRLVHPENYDRLQPSLSLTRLLLYSPAALKRIRAFVAGRPAFIVRARRPSPSFAEGF